MGLTREKAVKPPFPAKRGNSYHRDARTRSFHKKGEGISPQKQVIKKKYKRYRRRNYNLPMKMTDEEHKAVKLAETMKMPTYAEVAEDGSRLFREAESPQTPGFTPDSQP